MNENSVFSYFGQYVKNEGIILIYNLLFKLLRKVYKSWGVMKN